MYGDLHQHLRQKQRLHETEAVLLFKQLVRLVCNAHAKGIALRDIKLKKIVFEDQRRYMHMPHLLVFTIVSACGLVGCSVTNMAQSQLIETVLGMCVHWQHFSSVYRHPK